MQNRERAYRKAEAGWRFGLRKKWEPPAETCQRDIKLDYLINKFMK